MRGVKMFYENKEFLLDRYKWKKTLLPSLQHRKVFAGVVYDPITEL